MSSLDILYYTLTGSVFVLTIFIAVMLYYVVRMLRDAVYTVEKFTKVLKKVDEVADMAKEKLKSSGVYLAMAANAAKSLVEYFGEKKTSAKRKKKN